MVTVVLPMSAQSLLKNGKIPKDLVITLQRTMCFGPCPDYKLTVNSNGAVTFKGGQFTNIKGMAKGKITLPNLKTIISAFEQADFFNLKNSYAQSSDGCGEIWTDNPSEIISIQIEGKNKTVLHYFGCAKVAGNALERIVRLGQTIDKTTNSKRWVEK